MRIEFVLAGIVLGIVVAASRERTRRGRRSAATRLAHGETATAMVEEVWPQGRNGRRRQLELSYTDGAGRSRAAVVELDAAEAAAVSARKGGRLEIKYLATDPTDVLVVRPPVLDDRWTVSVLSGTVACALCMAIGALVK